MSLIGSLEQFSLASLLRRVESNGKTGVLKIQQEGKWVELYFRQGQLICIGPLRSNATLGDRLLQAGVISQSALQEALLAIGESQLSETRMALTLIDLGHVTHESLYAWAAKEATKVIGVLLTWRTGEVDFEEGLQPSIDRLLIALPIASLLPSGSLDESLHSGPTSSVAQESADQEEAIMSICDPPTLVLPALFIPEKTAASQTASSSFLSASSLVSLSNTNSGPFTPPPVSVPKRITRPLSAMPIDTSFMTPEMLLIPADLSGLHGQNLELELTPEQWRLMTRADGRTSLQETCLVLGMPAELVCRVAGELVALGLLIVSTPSSGPLDAAASVSKEPVRVGAGYLMPGYAAMSTAGSALPFSASGPVETVSQWGNGGSRATFVLGGGWVVASPSSGPLLRSGPLNVPNGSYAQVGGVR